MAAEATEGPRPRGEAEWSLRATARPSRPQATAGRRRLVGLLAVLLLVLVGAYLLRERILHSAVASPPVPALPPASSVPPAARAGSGAMLTSLDRSLAEKSADIALSVRVSGAGRPVLVSGAGVADFATGAVFMALRYGGRTGPARSIEVVSLRGESYVHLPGLSRLVTGKSWVAAPQPESLAPGSANPTSFLQALGQEGLSVRPLGTGRLRGGEVAAYSVNFPPAALARLSAAAPAALGAVRSLSMTAYFTAGSGLLSALEVALKMTLSGRVVSVAETLELSHYGVRTEIRPPAPAKVTTLGQLLARSGGRLPA